MGRDGARSLHGDRLKLGANLRLLDGSEVVGEFRLLSARIAGSLDIVSSTITGEEWAVDLSEAQIGGSLFIMDDRRFGDQRAKIDGLLTLSDAHIGSFLRFKNADFVGRTLTQAHPFDRPVRYAKRVAVLGLRCAVGDDAMIDADCTIEGGLVFVHASLDGDLVMDGLTISNPGDRSLDLGSATVRGSVVLRGLVSKGAMWLAGANIGGSLAMNSARLSDPDGKALVLGANVSIGGDLHLTDVITSGGSIRLRGAKVRGEVDAKGAIFDNPGGESLSLSEAEIGGAVRLNRVESHGVMNLNRSTIGGKLRLSDAQFVCDQTWDKNVEGHAIEITSSQLNGGAYLDWKSVYPSIDLFSSTTTILADLPSTWPSRSELGGFIYARLDNPIAGSTDDPWNVSARLRVLDSQHPFDYSPYEHAAHVYRSHGRFNDAEEILIAGRRRARGELVPHRTVRSDKKCGTLATTGPSGTALVVSAVRRLVDWLYDFTVRYGFRPARALGFLLVLIVAVCLSLTIPAPAISNTFRASGGSGATYSPDGPIAPQTTVSSERCGGGDVRCFQAIPYAIETVVPLLDLGQRSTWYPQPTTTSGKLYEAWLTFASVVGWTLSSIFILSFSRLGRTST